MADLISKAAAIKAFSGKPPEYYSTGYICNVLNELPAVDAGSMTEETGGKIVDFVQTMKDWKRMCRYYDAKYSMQACDRCPLEGCLAIYDDGGVEDYAEKGRKIGEWAAEHPEPVYPTWFEYLYTISNPDYFDLTEFYTWMRHTPISADIAQKLGITPKENN